jgi:predicted TIM-barrel fold metal-dependent hydrolase
MVIDMHGHWLSPGLREWGFSLVSLRNASAGAKPLKGLDEENQTNIKCMDERGIDLQILSIRPVSMLSQENPMINIPWCKVFNNVVAEGVKRRPERFRAMATLPQSDMKAAVEELERAVKELGLVGAIVNPNPKGDESTPPLDDDYWFPLYAKAQELDVPLFIHAAFLTGRRYVRYRLGYMLGQPLEETIAGPTLVYGGVLEEFSRLKIIIAHGGGGTTCQIGRYLNPPGREEVSLYGSKYKGSFLDGYKKLYFDGTLYTKEALELLIRVVGAERVLFGTETPGRGSFQYEGRMLDDLRPVVESIEWLTPAQKRMIFENNARRVFNLKGI